MFRNYIVTSWRNLLRNRVFSFINITGLAVGLAVGGLIYLYVSFEKSYDRFNANMDRLYRVPVTYASTGETGMEITPLAVNNPAVGPALEADFPEVEAATRMVRTSLVMSTLTLSYEAKGHDAVTFNEENIYLADPSFLTIFSYPAKEGAAIDALNKPQSIVLTQKLAAKYFGDESAVGRVMHINGQKDLTVTAVLDDVASNSHLQFDALISMNTLGEKWQYDNWTWPEFYTYVLLQPGSDPKVLEAKLPAFARKYMGRIMDDYALRIFFELQPVTDIHLKSDYRYEQSVNGDERTIKFLILLAVFVLSIAWINYVNLSTARSISRAKEVGLRKLAGASRPQLITQFFFDAFLVNAVALMLAVVILTLTIPVFESLTGKEMLRAVLASGFAQSITTWLVVAGVMLTCTLLTGLYPALIMSVFDPALVLKGIFNRSSSATFFRRSLVAFQYILSAFLIGGTITIYRQLTFMQDQDLGYAKEQMVIVRCPSVFNPITYGVGVNSDNRTASFLDGLRAHSAIKGVTASDDIPGHSMNSRNNMRRGGQDPSFDNSTSILATQPTFFETYGVDLVAGRAFTDADRFSFNKSNRIMLNEKATELLGYKNPNDALHTEVTSRVVGAEYTGEVIGIVKNYHQESLHSDYTPILYYYPANETWKYFSIRMNTVDARQTVKAIESLYAKAFPNDAFDYFFLDEHFNAQYSSDVKFGTIFGSFTLVAIVIACLGLFGLSVFDVTHRVKEIGIRKILGAPVVSILALFSKTSLQILIIAYLIAAPLIYLAANGWLKNFAFAAKPGWQVFILPPLILGGISLATICLVCLQSAFMNPTHALRHE